MRLRSALALSFLVLLAPAALAATITVNGAASVAAVTAQAVSVPCTGSAPAGWFIVGDGPVVGPKQ